MTEVEVDEVLGLCGFGLVSSSRPRVVWSVLERTVGDEATEVAADNAVPGRSLALIKLCAQYHVRSSICESKGVDHSFAQGCRCRGITDRALNVLCDVLLSSC